MTDTFGRTSLRNSDFGNMLSILSSVISILLLLLLKYYAETARLEYVIKWFLKGGVSLYDGFLQGIFSGEGAKSIVMQISFVVLIFLLLSNQISRGQTASGAPSAPCRRNPICEWVKHAKTGLTLWKSRTFCKLEWMEGADSAPSLPVIPLWIPNWFET